MVTRFDLSSFYLLFFCVLCLSVIQLASSEKAFGYAALSPLGLSSSR